MRLMSLFGGRIEKTILQPTSFELQPIKAELELPEPTEIAREFELACLNDLPKAIRMLKLANGNPAVVGMKDTTGWGLPNKGTPESMLLKGLDKLNDDDFCVVFSALARVFEKSVPAMKLQLCMNLINRTEVRCPLVEDHLMLVHDAHKPRFIKDQTPAINLMNHFVSERLVDAEPKETLQQSCDFLAALKKAGLQIFSSVRSEISNSRNSLMVNAFAAVHGENFIQSTRDELGNSLLHKACLRRDNPEVVERLIELGCDPLIKNNGGETPLLMSAKLDNEVALGALIRSHKYQENDLNQAIEKRPSGMVRALLEAERARIYIESVTGSIKPTKSPT